MIEHKAQTRPDDLKPVPLKGVRGAMLVRNICIDGRRTSIRVEPIFWQGLQAIAAQEGVSIHDIATEIAAGKAGRQNFTSALRCFVLDYWFRRSAPGWRRFQLSEDEQR